MKLFGNYSGASRSGRKRCKNSQKGTGWWHSMGKTKRVLMVVLSVLLVLVLALAVFVKVYIKPPEVEKPILSGETIDPDTHESVIIDSNDDGLKPGYYNILLAGTDGDGLRTDTMMIARLDAVNHTVALMSIPRDTLIETKTGIAKLNSVYGTYGCGTKGMEALMLELQDILGFMPNGYALVNLDAFVELVDVIGGVYYDVPQRMYHNDPTQDLLIDLQPGYQLLDGEKAMQLVRFRGYAQADIERTHVQQQFIIAVAKKCMSLSNWNKISEYIDIFSRNVTTSYTVGNLLYFAQELMNCDLDQMTTYTLPGTDATYDAAYYVLIEEEVAAIVEKDFNPYLN